MNDALAAAIWGGIAASSLLIGGFVALRAQPSKRLVGLVLAFGTGTLISSVAYELVPEEAIDAVGVGLALAIGGLVFYFGDAYVDRMGGENRKDLDATAENTGSGQSIVLGTILDGIPESLVLGIGLAVGGAISAAFLAAVFISNLPEAIAATVSLKASGVKSGPIYRMWAGIVGISAAAAAIGYGIASAAGSSGILVQAFAAGALLTMIIDTMAPEAVQHGGKVAGLATLLGFAVAATLSGLE